MASKSIDQFCESQGFSRRFFYILEKRGEAPRTYNVGRLRRISDESEREWQAAREAASAAPTAA